MKFYVTRHGQTAWNLENKVCGATDLPLTNAGIAQARETAERIAHEKIDLIISSPMKRALQTAQILNRERRIPLLTDRRLREQNYGRFEGGPRDDPEFLANKRKFAFAYPGGESHMQVAARVYSFLEEARARYQGKTLLIVCHGGICRVIESYFRDMENEEFASLSFHNCEVRKYEI